MKNFVVVTVSIFLLSFVEKYNCNDPCSKNTYQEIDDTSRSTSKKWKHGTKANCDSTLVMGWYPFMQGEMPTKKVDVNRCGTQSPIWMRGELPKVEKTEVTRLACINHFGLNNGCFQSFPIEVMNCGSYYVYHLKPTSGCPMAYCAGKCVALFVSM